MRRVDLAGAAHLELVSGVAQLRPEDAMVEAMLRGWAAQQAARGLREETISARERLVRQFAELQRFIDYADDQVERNAAKLGTAPRRCGSSADRCGVGFGRLFV